jgi:predicted Zn-dependent peptidase
MKMFRSILSLMLLLGATFAQQTSGPPSLPAGLPPTGPLKPVVSAPVEERRLANGMSLWMVQRSELPKVVLTLVVRGGDSIDPPAAPGLSRLMSGTVTQGTTTKSSREIAEAAEGTGGDLSATVDGDCVRISLNALTEHAMDAVALIADVAQNANSPDNEVALAKSNMEDELRSNEAKPRFLARRAWYQVTYGDHPYHIVGEHEDP